MITDEKHTQKYIDLVFDGKPVRGGGKLIRLQDPEGNNLDVGKWVCLDDGYWVLRMTINDFVKPAK